MSRAPVRSFAKRASKPAVAARSCASVERGVAMAQDDSAEGGEDGGMGERCVHCLPPSSASLGGRDHRQRRGDCGPADPPPFCTAVPPTRRALGTPGRFWHVRDRPRRSPCTVRSPRLLARLAGHRPSVVCSAPLLLSCSSSGVLSFSFCSHGLLCRQGQSPCLRGHAVLHGHRRLQAASRPPRVPALPHGLHSFTTHSPVHGRRNDENNASFPLPVSPHTGEENVSYRSQRLGSR